MLRKGTLGTKELLYRFVRNLFVQTGQTPNPNSLKFIPQGKRVMDSGTMDFAAPRFTHVSPLARHIFNIDGVTRVFYGGDYITVTKKEDSDWKNLKPQVFGAIVDHYTSGAPLFTDEAPAQDTLVLPDDSEVVAMIKEIIETRVRPVVQDDGGDITYKGFDEPTGVWHLKRPLSVIDSPS
eukprot:TRINITY_DN4022_c0_g1_i1.p1 TRINITY_DN4022_c0_g1~~TRINITY_DN4022_c0_g1_i1.p1  ORF type:complete len:180 (+),score=16.86 TRINITY_DN4022_c0_g1_i1:132-671(+)